MNRTFVRLFGYEESEAQMLCDCGASLYEDPRQRERLLALARSGAAAEVDGEIVRMRAKDGSRRIVQFALRSIRFEGEPCALSHLVNLTGEWEMTERIRQSEERYRRLFESAPDAICVLEERDGLLGAIVDCNDAMVRLFGFTKEELERMGPTDLVLDLPPERVRAIEATLREGKVDVSNFIGRTKGGRRVEIENRSVSCLCNGRLSVLVFIRDITARREAERALRLNEESIRVGLRDMGMILFRQDAQLRYTWLYDSEKGYLSDLVLGTTDRTWLDEADAQAREIWKRGVLESGKPARFTLGRPGEGEGGRRLFDYIVEPLRDEDGQTIGLTGSALDVTGRELVRTELQVARDLFERIASTAPVAIFRMDATGRLTYVNEEAEKFSGRARAQLLQLTLMDLVPTWDLANTLEEWARITNEKQSFSGESCIVLPDGSERWGLVNVRPLVLADGRLEIIGSVTDITDRMREQQVLHALVEARSCGDRFFSELLRRVAELLAVEHAYLVECSGKTGTCSRLTALWSGGEDITNRCEWRLPDDCPGDSPHCGVGACGSVGTEAEARTGECRRRWAKDAQVQAAAPLRGKDGQVLGFIGVMSAKPMRAAAQARLILERVATALATDVERMREQEERRRVEAQLYQSQKLEALGSLAGGIAHDFNNILTGVLNYTMLAMDEGGGALSGDVRQYLGEVLRAGTRARDLVKQILAFSRPAEKLPLGARQAVEVLEVARDVLALVRPTAPSSIEFKLVAADEVRTVWGDGAQIHQVLLNLCVNALQAMRDRVGEIRITVENHRQSSEAVRPKLPPGRYVRVQVEDQGIGIEPQAIPRIFDPFYTTRERQGGTGLGLAVVQGIVQNHGGSIEVESVPGHGSVFRFYLPESAERAVPIDFTSATIVRGRGQRIMVVDDEPTSGDSLTLLLRRSGYQVANFAEPEHALAALWAAPDSVEVLVTDLQMPRLTGIMLAERARAARPDLPVILMSGHLDEAPGEVLERVRFSAVLAKPVPLAQMTAAISRALHPPR